MWPPASKAAERPGSAYPYSILPGPRVIAARPQRQTSTSPIETTHRVRFPDHDNAFFAAACEDWPMSSGDYIRASFAKRFAPAGSDFIYRSVPGAAGMRVSAGERREIEDDLDRRIRRLGLLANGWVLAGVTLAPIALLQAYGANDLVKLAALFCVVMLAFVLPQLRLERNVMKRVADRTPIDSGLSWTEKTLVAAAEQSWYQAVIFFLAPLASLHKLATSRGLDAPSRVVFISVAILAAVAGFVSLSAKAWLALRRQVRS